MDLGPWTGHRTQLCLNFLTCKMVIMLTLEGHVTATWDNVCRFQHSAWYRRCVAIHLQSLSSLSQGVSISFPFQTKLEVIAVLRSDSRGHSQHCHAGEPAPGCGGPACGFPRGGGHRCAAARLLGKGRSPELPSWDCGSWAGACSLRHLVPPIWSAIASYTQIACFSKPPVLSPQACGGHLNLGH